MQKGHRLIAMALLVYDCLERILSKGFSYFTVGLMTGLCCSFANALVSITGCCLHIVYGCISTLAVFHVPENAGGGGAQNGSCDDDLIHDFLIWFVIVKTSGVPEILKEFPKTGAWLLFHTN